MSLDTENPIVQLCAKGMSYEGEGKPDEAMRLFEQAWQYADEGWEKAIAAHYVARHQATFQKKLHWDKIALSEGLSAAHDGLKAWLPSLYLNVAKGYEDSGDTMMALEHYRLAESFIAHLPEDGYGKMIAQGIRDRISRVSA